MEASRKGVFGGARMDIKLIPNPTKEWAEEVANKIKAMFPEHSFVDKGADITILIGGDGTLFYNKHLIEGIAIAIGSQTSKRCHIMYNELNKLRDMLSSPSYIELPLLEVESREKHYAMNDVVVHTSNHATLDLDISIDSEKVYCRGDGVIITTPLGSSAYNLSAGGPLISLFSEAMGLTCICPIEKMAPLVYPPVSTEVVVRGNADLVVDGEVVEKNVERIRVKKSKKKIKYYYKAGLF